MSAGELNLTTAQSIAVALVPKFTGALSILGSAYVVQHVVCNPRRMSMTYHRILLGLAVTDILSSCTAVLSTWPIPEGTEEVAWAVGNTATCTATGFVKQAFGLCTPLYNASLYIFYLLVFVKQWSPKEVSQRIQKYLLAVPLLFGLSTGIVGIALDLYNATRYTCWIMPLPRNCDDNSLDHHQPTCIRGHNAWYYQIALTYAEVWIVAIFMAISLFIIYRHVYKLELVVSRIRLRNHDAGMASSPPELGRVQGASRTSSTTPPPELLINSRKVGRQALHYVLALYSSWFFVSLSRIVRFITGSDDNHDVLVYLHVVFFPLQGFWNALIYMRPHYEAWKRNGRRTNSNTLSLWPFFFWCENHVSENLCFCCCHDDDENRREEEVEQHNNTSRSEDAVENRTDPVIADDDDEDFFRSSGEGIHDVSEPSKNSIITDKAQPAISQVKETETR